MSTIIMPSPQGGIITAKGFYDISDEAYHADPCVAPSLSRSIAHIIVEQSCRHAWTAHPRLNPKHKQKEAGAEADIGKIAHDIVLGAGDKVVWIDAKDWRKTSVQEERDAAIAAGKTPSLLKNKERVEDMIAALHQQLSERDHAKNALQGHKHKTAVWQEGDIWCRAQLDSFDDEWVDDYKTTGGSAEPDDWIRNHLFNDGGHIQSVFYPRGANAVDGKKRGFRFIVQENYEPYAVSIITVDPHIVAKATEQMEFAIDAWSDCLRENKWPAYSKRMVWANMLPYIEMRWEAKKVALEMSGAMKKKPQGDQDPARLLAAG